MNKRVATWKVNNVQLLHTWELQHIFCDSRRLSSNDSVSAFKATILLIEKLTLYKRL